MAAAKATKKQASRGLGKGLSALMSDSYSQTAQELFANEVAPRSADKHVLPLNKIRSGKYQPREYFNETALSELASSIRRNGVMQPIIVRAIGEGQYEIIAGERRWRAAKIAGLDEIPVVIKDIPNEHVLEIAIVENVQREDLHPLEEAGGYQKLMSEFGYTQDDIATTVHKSRSHIANLLRLLSLPREIQDLLSSEKLTMGHARALIGSEKAVEIAEEVVRRNLNVRQTEKLVSHSKNPDGIIRQRKPREPKAYSYPPSAPAPAAPGVTVIREKDSDIMALEETLSENLGLKVSINDRGQAGEIVIGYESLEQLDDILRRLGGSI
jgi:ParB family chromosome partitioning protein